MYNILVVDLSKERDTVAKVFRDADYHVEVSESAYDAMSKLKAFDFDLIVSEVELPGDNAFELYNYIFSHYPYIPTIMITGKEIDVFFESLYKENIGNVLCKPIIKDELINLSKKLILKKDIFGLQNYMADVTDINKIRIRSSKKIQESINAAINQIEKWGFKIENKVILNLVLNEMLINAVYHSHGYTREKEERLQVDLKKDEFVDIYFARNGKGFGIAVSDYRGKLSKEMILKNLNKAIKQSQLILRAAETGEEISQEVSETGRGLDLLRKIAKDFYFIIKKDVRTEIIIIFDGKKENGERKGSSLKIIEDK